MFSAQFAMLKHDEKRPSYLWHAEYLHVEP